MTPELEARILTLFASGLGWEDAAAEVMEFDVFDNPDFPGAVVIGLNPSELRTAVQKLWREYVSGKDAA